ncbi:MarR family winged helix-turn-helix transcriptional regulator [Streptomyces sp. cg2]|uniref:MarR family winged helix-turn-helix transcriptional regulator n=1 Tax=Streptomyces sp. cg2 TaxID=3238799 RepID=UPI0034E275A0
MGVWSGEIPSAHISKVVSGLPPTVGLGSAQEGVVPSMSPEATKDSAKVARALTYELAAVLDEHVRSCLGGLDLTPTQAGALRELSDPITMRELAVLLCCEPSNVSYVVDRMVKNGWIERRPHPSDRRAKQLVLTEEGSSLREQLMERLARDNPLGHLSPQEIGNLEQCLRLALKQPTA